MITHDMNHAIVYGNRLTQGKNRGRQQVEEKKNLTVEDLMRSFHRTVENFGGDELVLG